MGDFDVTQRISQVNLRDALRDEYDVPEAILGGRPQGDALADKRFRQPYLVSFERDPPVLLHVAHEVIGAVFRLGQALWPGARTWLIALRRHGVIERLMRPLRIVDDAPGVEDRLPTAEIFANLLLQDRCIRSFLPWVCG